MLQITETDLHLNALKFITMWPTIHENWFT